MRRAHLIQQRRTSWPKQTAVVVGESSNVHMLLKEILRTYNWSVVDTTESIEHAVSAIRQGLANLLILDDTADISAIASLRYLISDPMGVLTPTLSFVRVQNQSNTNAMRKMGSPQIVEKPLTPAKFIPGFVDLVKRWEKEPFVSLRKSVYHLQAGDEPSGLRLLAKLKGIPQTSHLASQALSIHLQRMGRLKDAETILLAALKASPRDLGTMLSLSDLYMHAAMPALAIRLLFGARSAFGNTIAVYADLVHAHLLCGEVDKAIDLLYQLRELDYLTNTTTEFLTRLLFAEGRESEAEKALNHNKVEFRKLKSNWAAAEKDPFDAAG